MALNPAKTVTNPRIAKLIELEIAGRIKPEHQQELNTYRAQGLAPKDGAAGTESERNAAFLTTRLAGALNTIGEVRKNDPAGLEPGYLPNAVGKIFGDTAQNIITPGSRQRVEAAQLEALDSALTLGTGAAYTKEQLEGYRKAYFPVLGDDEGAIRDKQQRLRTVVEAARVKAGSASGDIDKALAAAGWLGDETTAQGAVQAPAQAVDIAGASNDPAASVRQLTPEQNAEYQRIAQTGDPAAIVSYLKGIGYDIANADEVVSARDKGAGINANTTVRRAPVSAANPDGALGAGVRGAADTLTAGFLDEAGALVDTVGDAFGGRLAPGGFGDSYNANLDANRSVLANDAENQGAARFAGQLIGGLPLPVIGGAPTIANLARTGAIYGGAYGAGSSDGGLADRGLNALVSAGIGAAGGAGFGAAASRLGRGGGGPRPPTPGQEVYEAATRQGIEPLAADVGGPLTRRVTAGLAQSPISGGSINRAGERVVNQARTARDRIAADVGNAVEPVAAGEAAQAGAQSYIANSRQQTGRLYDRARRLSDRGNVEAPRALQTIQDNITELAETPDTSAPVINALTRLQNDLGAEGGVSVDALRRLRTNVRGLAQTDELRATDFERRAGQVLDAVSQDLSEGLNPQARRAFRVADAAYRERAETIDQVLKPIIGGRGDKALAPEQIYQNIQSASRSDSGRLRRFLDTLPDDERASVSATVISQLGRATDGGQNAAGDAFSLNSFLTQWNRMTPRAKASLLPGQSRAALDDLARVAEGSRAAGQYANRSNTGGANAVNALFAGSALAYLQPSFIFAGLANYGAGRLLASPRFAQWLARPVSTPQQAAQAVRRLSTIATREPAIANDILGIQQRLQQAMGSGAAVAGEPRDER